MMFCIHPLDAAINARKQPFFVFFVFSVNSVVIELRF
jgi:hypothetical protein